MSILWALGDNPLRFELEVAVGASNDIAWSGGPLRRAHDHLATFGALSGRLPGLQPFDEDGRTGQDAGCRTLEWSLTRPGLATSPGADNERCESLWPGRSAAVATSIEQRSQAAIGQLSSVAAKTDHVQVQRHDRETPCHPT